MDRFTRTADILRRITAINKQRILLHLSRKYVVSLTLSRTSLCLIPI